MSKVLIIDMSQCHLFYCETFWNKNCVLKKKFTIIVESLKKEEKESFILFTYLNFRDRIRTAINVLGDSYGAAIVAHLSKEELMGAELHATDQELVVIEEEPEKSNGDANV